MGHRCRPLYSNAASDFAMQLQRPSMLQRHKAPSCVIDSTSVQRAGGAAPSSVKQGNVNVAGAANTLCRAVAKGFRSWFKSLALFNRFFGFCGAL